MRHTKLLERTQIKRTNSENPQQNHRSIVILLMMVCFCSIISSNTYLPNIEKKQQPHQCWFFYLLEKKNQIYTLFERFFVFVVVVVWFIWFKQKQKLNKFNILLLLLYCKIASKFRALFVIFVGEKKTIQKS